MIFKDANGVDTIASRLLQELTLQLHPSSSTSAEDIVSENVAPKRRSRKRKSDVLPTRKGKRRVNFDLEAIEYIPYVSDSVREFNSAFKILVHSFITLLTSCLHEGYSDGSDNRITNLIRSSTFSEILSNIFMNPVSSTQTVLTAAYSLVSEAINNDPSPPSVLTTLLSSGVVDSCIEALKSSVHVSSEYILSASTLVSSLSLSEDSLLKVRRHEVLTHIVGFMTDSRFFSPRSRVFMGDLAIQLGNNFEELLRHHPPHIREVSSAILNQLNDLIRITESNIESALEQSTYLTYMHMTHSLLVCLEPLLGRASAANELIRLDGVVILGNVLKIALSPPKFLLSILSSSIDPITYSIGYHPIIRMCLKCLTRLGEVDPKQYSEKLVVLITSSKEVLRSHFESYWKIHTPGKCLQCGSQQSKFKDGKMINCSHCHRGTYCSKDCQKKDWSQHKLQCDKRHKKMVRVEHFLDTVSRSQVYEDSYTSSDHAFQFVQVLKSMLHMDYLIEALSSIFSSMQSIPKILFFSDDSIVKKTFLLMQTLVHDVYVPTQIEICRARGLLSDERKSPEIRGHPIYRLLVVAQDGVVVKSAVDDSGKKVCKLERGAIIDAVERKATANSVLKYKVEGGWVAYLRHTTSTEPQIQVINIIPKLPEMETDEGILNSSLDTPQKIFDFEKFANVSSRRGGFMALFHFHSVFRKLLSCLCRSMAALITDEKEFAEKKEDICKQLQPYISLVLVAVGSLLPPTELDFPFQLNLSHTGIIDKTNEAFISYNLPNPNEFSISHTFRAIHVEELVSTILFEEKRMLGRTDCNMLLLIHLYYSGQLELLLRSTALVYLSCLLPKQGATNIEEENERKLIRDRRVLAVSNISNIIDLWKHILSVVSSSLDSDPLSKRLQMLSNDSHDFDINIFRRKIVLLVLRYVYQCWTHPLLSSLPPTAVRSILDLIQVCIKALQDAKSMSPRFVASTRSREPSSRQPESLLSLLAEGGSARARDFFRGQLGRRLAAENEGESIQLETSDAMVPVEEPPLDSTSIAVNALPEISKHSDETIASDKSTIVEVLKQVYRSVHPSCLTLLAQGLRSPGVHWSAEVAATNQSFTRELTTVMVLKEMMRCYDRSTTLLSTLQVIHLAWLFRRTLPILRSDQGISHSYALYGLLHGILLMLTGKVNLKGGGEALVFIFSRDSRYGVLNELLITCMEKVFLASPDESTVLSNDLEWIAPALLILDVFSQPYLVDRNAMKTTLNELDKVLEANRHKAYAELFIAPEAISIMRAELGLPPPNRVETVVGVGEVSELMCAIAPEAQAHDASDELPVAAVTIEATPPPQCAICRNYLSEPCIEFNSSDSSGRCVATGACGHKFHQYCIEKWTVNRLNCPLCETPWLCENVDIIELVSDGKDQPLDILREGGLSSELKKRAMHVSLNVLKTLHKDDKQASQKAQACYLLLSHILVDEEVKLAFCQSDGVDLILSSKAAFPNPGNFIFTILQHVFEDAKGIATVMDSAVKAALSPRFTSNGGPIPLKIFIDALSPLIIRNQRVFLEVIRNSVSLVRQDKGVYVTLKASEKSDHATASTVPVPERTDSKIEKKNDEATPLGNRLRSISGDSTARNRPNSNKKTDAPVHYLPQHMYAAFENLVLAILQQLANVLHKLVQPSLDVPPTSCLPLSELLYTLADLVYTVPGLATCVHRYNVSKVSCTNYPMVASCLRVTKHAISGSFISSPRLLTFLLHNLIAYDTELDECRRRLTGPDAADTWNKVVEDLKSLAGSNVEDAAAYFLAALIARPGDGRRRALEELLHVLRGGERLDTSRRIKATLAIAKTLTSLVVPPISWISREIFTVPVKENIILLANLGTHKVLAEALCRLDNEQNMAKEATQHISICVEMIIRKGIPLLHEQAKVPEPSTSQGAPTSQTLSPKRDANDHEVNTRI